MVLRVRQPLFGPLPPSAAIAGTQQADTAAASIAVINRASLEAVQAVDTAAVANTVTNRSSLAPLQAADTSAVTATVTNRSALAATQAPDAASLGAAITNRVSIQAQQAPDTAVIGAQIVVPVAIAATQAVDAASVAVTAAQENAASINAVQPPDQAALQAQVVNTLAIAPTQAADAATLVAVIGSIEGAIAVTQASDQAAVSVETPNRTGAGRRGKRRRVVLGDQVYDVLERDLPTLLEAVMLNRKPPATAVVTPVQADAPDQQAEAPAVAMRLALPSLDEARERYEAMLADINRAATADVAALLQRVADRVLADLQDDEDAAVTLLLH